MRSWGKYLKSRETRIFIVLAIWQTTEISKLEKCFSSGYHMTDREKTGHNAKPGSCYEESFEGPTAFPLDSINNVHM